MTFVGFGLAVVALAVAAFLFVRSSSQRKTAEVEKSDLQARLDAESARAQASAQAAAEAVVEQSRLQEELDVAIARNDEKAIAKALWNLELERNVRQWNDVMATEATAATTQSTGEQLTMALGHEVDRLREEVGVAIRFDGGLDAEFEPETALATLRITAELLSLTAKHCDEVVLSLDQIDVTDESSAELVIALDCFSWDDEDESPEVATQPLAAMAEKVDGHLSWKTASDEEVKAELRVVLPRV